MIFTTRMRAAAMAATLLSASVAAPPVAATPEAQPIHWQATATIDKVGQVDCTTLPMLDYLLVRFHTDGGYIHNYEVPPSTQIYITQGVEWPPSQDPAAATKKACDSIFDTLRAAAFMRPGIEFAMLHPFGGPTDGYGDDPRFRAAANTNFSIPRRYLPTGFMQVWKKEGLGTIKDFVYFGDAYSDDIVMVGKDYYYESTFSEGIPLTNTLTCRGKLSLDARFSLPLKGIYCF